MKIKIKDAERPYFISCSNERKTSVSKKAAREMPSPSHKSFSVTTPGFWLLPYKMFVTVDGATPASKPSERLFQRILHIRADFARKLLTSKKKYGIIYTFVILGRRQAVRHRTLTPAFAGSNPAVPARKKHLYKASAFFNEICRCATREMARRERHLRCVKYPLRGC